jgi:hypothetical protein
MNPPSLLDIDLLLLKLQQRQQRVLSFQFTHNALPWQAALEQNDTGTATLSVMLELAALPFTAEAAGRRLMSVATLQALNLFWQKHQQPVRIGLSPRRNTVFLVATRVVSADQLEIPAILASLATEVIGLQGAVQVVAACAPWLLSPHQKTGSLRRGKR